MVKKMTSPSKETKKEYEARVARWWHKKYSEADTHAWVQRSDLDIVKAAMDRAKTDPDAINLRLHKLTKLVNHLLATYANGGRS